MKPKQRIMKELKEVKDIDINVKNLVILSYKLAIEDVKGIIMKEFEIAIKSVPKKSQAGAILNIVSDEILKELKI